MIITDVDGTLIDQRTYSYELSLPAVRRLQAKQIPIVLCSTKTSAEIILLWRELELDDPFICENGGAIYMPRDYLKVALLGLKTDGPFEVLEIGIDVDRLRVALEDAARACGVTLRTFGKMEVDEIAALTGLSLDQAARQKGIPRQTLEAWAEKGLLTLHTCRQPSVPPSAEDSGAGKSARRQRRA